MCYIFCCMLGGTPRSPRAIEQWAEFLKAKINSGEAINLGTEGGGIENFGSSQTYPEHRQIPAAAIRAALLDKERDSRTASLKVHNAVIVGPLDLDSCEIKCDALFVRCAFLETFSANDADFRRITLDKCVLASSSGTSLLDIRATELSLRDVAFRTRIDLSGSVITRAGSLIGLSLLSPTNQPSIGLERVRVGNDLELSGIALTSIEASRLSVGGDLKVRGSFDAIDDLPALCLDGCSVTCDAILTHLVANGEVRALNATFGRLVLSGTISTPYPKGTEDTNVGIGFDGVTVLGTTMINELNVVGQFRGSAMHLKGEVMLESVSVAGEELARLAVDELGAAISVEGSRACPAIVLDNTRMDSDARISVSAIGAVRAVGMVVAGDLDMEGSVFVAAGQSPVALAMDGVNVKGRADFTGIRALGVVQAAGARFESDISFEGAQLLYAPGPSLYLDRLQVAHGLNLKLGKGTGAIVLTGSNIGTLDLPDENSAHIFSRTLSAHGWKLGDIRGAPRRSRSVISNWLDHGHGRKQEFTAQPWQEIASVYERNGQPADARWIRYSAANRATEHSAWPSWPIRWAYLLFAGHGYYPLVAAIWIVVLFFCTWGFVEHNRSDFTPVSSGVAISTGIARIDATLTCEELKKRKAPCFRPGVYALETVLPATAQNGQTAVWRPDPPIGERGISPALLSIVKGLGWILTAILLGGVTGLLKKS